MHMYKYFIHLIHLHCIMLVWLSLLLKMLSASSSDVYPAWVTVNKSLNNILINIVKTNPITANEIILENPVQKALDSFPLIDGHNDLPYHLYSKLQNDISNFPFQYNLTNTKEWNDIHTDITRLKKGKVGGVFWSAFTFCETQYKDAVARTLEQIDVIKRLVQKHYADLKFVTSSSEILDAFADGKVASMIGVEGGHSIDSRLGVLRMYYELGVRYLSLTHTCDTPWAGSASFTIEGLEDKKGLSPFGKKIISEMNRLGMIVDLSHVSYNVMLDALSTSIAPVMFSHSSVYNVFPHPRNVANDVLKLLQQNRGIVMVNFYPGYSGNSLEAMAEHVNYVVDLIGPDHVGFGSDFDGIPETITGLEDVSKYPNLLDVIYRSNPERWTQRNLEKLIGRNFVRVFQEVEKVKRELAFADPIQEVIEDADLNKTEAADVWACRSRNQASSYKNLIDKLSNY